MGFVPISSANNNAGESIWASYRPWRYAGNLAMPRHPSRESRDRSVRRQMSSRRAAPWIGTESRPMPAIGLASRNRYHDATDWKTGREAK